MPINKKKVVLNLTLTIGLMSTFVAHPVHAETATQIQEKRSQIQSDIAKTDEEIAKARAEMIQLNEQIVRVDQAIKDNEKMITKTKEDIAAAEEEVKQIEEEVAELQENIDRRSEILKDRAVTLQQNGGSVSYLDVIFGSQSFGDFIDRVSLVNKITKADTDLLEQHQADKEEIEEKQNAVEEKLSGLKEMKVEYEGMQAQILEQKEQNELLKKELKEKEENNLELKAELQSKDYSLSIKENQINSGSQAQSTNSSGNIEQYSAQSNQVSIPANLSGNVEDVISAGYKYIGRSVYVFGGGRNSSDIARGRFDCSGFVHYAFSQAGISVGTSTSSLSRQGTKVSTSEMRPGDLVFFDTYKNDGHVGIYIGNNQFIGSQNNTGVAIANMGSGYWAEKFDGHVRRIIQ
ncbi:C40 family peptidase [Aquibacillus kalidii]|uniref:C40 family peptidase n=1 Tax=Aquibacillus kalidii TaxID=2762597 RepID=UPI002E2B161B|nr:NlpC/P60 family protein [Aquibacillus kalidii]